VCFLIAFVNAAVWGFVVPPFQVPDEIAHFGYAQYVAQTGRPPPARLAPPYSEQEQRTLESLDFFNVIGRPQLRGILDKGEQRVLRAQMSRKLSALGFGGQTSITDQPPLYYYLQAVPYWLSPSTNILTRLAFMRLFSALLVAATVLTVFMFLRELFPRTAWCWTVGALVVAFQPTFNFIASGVQGDSLLFLASAATLLVLLRSWRHGFTRRRGLALGAVVAVGLLSKLTFIALVPGIGVALLLLTARELRRDRAQALQAFALALAVAAVPYGIYALLNVYVWDRGGPTAGGIGAATNSTLPSGTTVTLNQTLDYVWELYLPPLWFMHHRYFAKYPGWELWLNGSIGHFGWLDYVFPSWVYEYCRWVFYALVAFAFAGLVRLRRGLLPLAPIFLCFGVMGLGLLGAIGYSGIRYRLSTGYAFEQARYLFPMIAFWGAFAVLAARGWGRRWGPVLAGAIVVAAMAHGLFAETLTISRYYG
jgi:4-amino-4-deoxy-L-arabinose transferase-like glycosyltransferase